MSYLGEIPGLHRRSCATCGQEALLTEEVSRRVAQGGRTETRQALCLSCGSPVVYTIPTTRAEPTTTDVTPLGEYVREAKARLRARLSTLRRGRSTGIDGNA